MQEPLDHDEAAYHREPRHPPGAMTIKTFCSWAGIGRSTAYRLMAEGSLPAVKVGKRRLVRISDAADWLASLPDHDEAHRTETAGKYRPGSS